MKRNQMVLLVAVVLLAASLSLRVDAATKYKPCSLLTAVELETALHGKVDRSAERDTTMPDGPFKGDIMSTCDWVVGSNTVTLNVIRGPKSPQEQAAFLARLRATEETLKKRGWTIEAANIPGADCTSFKPPASEHAAPGSQCFMVSKGLAFGLGINGSVTVQQVKALADTVAARL